MSKNHPVLSTIKHPSDVKTLPFKKLLKLVAECRQRIVEVTSQSSLGTVE